MTQVSRPWARFGGDTQGSDSPDLVLDPHLHLCQSSPESSACRRRTRMYVHWWSKSTIQSRQTRTKETVTLDIGRPSKSFQCFAGRKTGCSLLNDLSFGSQEGHWQSHLPCFYQSRVQTPTMLEQPKRGSLLQWILPENSTLRARNKLAVDMNYATEAGIVFTHSISLENNVL